MAARDSPSLFFAAITTSTNTLHPAAQHLLQQSEGKSRWH
jgi:hypothetical protein